MAKKKFSPWVIMPYEELLELHEASLEFKTLKKEHEQLKRQMNSLRIIQQECLEKIREIDRYL